MRKSKLLIIAAAFTLVAALVVGCPGNGGDGNGGNGGDGPTPASFSVSNLSIEPAEVLPNETVTISVSVANTGGSQGSHNVVLNIDGVQEESKSVTIAAGASQSVTFSVTREDAGIYTVTIGSLSGSFTVVSAISAEEIAEAAILAEAEFNTYQFDVDYEITMEIPGETPVTTTMDMNGAFDFANEKMHMDMQMTMSTPPETVQMSIEMYLVGDWMYMKMEMPGLPPEIMGTWFKVRMSELELEDLWEQQDIAGQQFDLLVGFSEVEFLGTEMVNGVECYKLQVTPDIETLWAWAQIQEGTEGLDPGLDPEEVITDFSYVLWVAKDTYFTVKTVVEMTMTVEGESMGMAVTVLVFDINEPVTIELPPEAEAAEELPTS